MAEAIMLQTPDLQEYVENGIHTEDNLIQMYGLPQKDLDWKLIAKRAIKRKLKCSGQRIEKLVKRVFPPADWVPKYNVRESLARDIIAGLTVGVIHLPQGMAYGLLSSLPAITGLYVSFIPVLVYVLFGTSRQVSIGTFAVVSLMIAQVINENVTPCPPVTSVTSGTTVSNVASTVTTAFETGSPYTEAASTASSCEIALNRRKMELAVALAMSNGIIQVAMSILRLGIITSYLSTHLISGFTCGAAFHVLTSQVSKLLGISVQRYNGPLALIYAWIDLFRNITTINWATVIISVICIVFLISGKMVNEKFHKRLPIPLPWELGVVIFGTIASYFGNFKGHYGVEIVGEIPTGIEVSVPTLGDIGTTMLGGFPIAIVAFATEISLSQMFATKHSYKIDSNQELLAMGIGNMCGSFFSCFPLAPSLSRSVICDEVGARTQLYGLFSSALILIVLLWLGPLFESLPQAALASIIIVNLKGMLKQFEKIPPIWRVNKLDAVTWVVTWASVVLLGVSLGLGVAVAFQVFTVVWQTQFAKGAMLGQVAASGEFRDVNKYRTKAKNHPNVVVFRFPGPIIFVNSERFKAQIFHSLGFDPTLATKAVGETGASLQHHRHSNPSLDPEEENLSPAHANSTLRRRSSTLEDRMPNGRVSPSAVADENGTGVTDHARLSSMFSMDRRRNVTHFVLDMSCCPYVDNDGAISIKYVHLSLLKVDIKLFLASCSAEFRRVITLVCEQQCPLFFTSLESAMAVAKGDVNVEFEDAGFMPIEESNNDTRL